MSRFQVIGVLCALCALASSLAPSVSKRCLKTNKAYPERENASGKKNLVVNVRPAPRTEFSACPYPEEHCCSSITEYYMREVAKEDFPLLVHSKIQGKLVNLNRAIADSSLTPTVFHEGFNTLVQSAGEVSYQELTWEALRYYLKDSCRNHAVTESFINKNVYEVKSIADSLKALYTGMDAIKNALEVAKEMKFSTECITSVMANGLYSGIDNKMMMCQVCHRDTALKKVCENTCKNVARGCLNQLTEVGALIDALAAKLDMNHYALLKNIERESATGVSSLAAFEEALRFDIEDNAEFGAECRTDADYTYTLNPSQSQPANFSAAPLYLAGMLADTADFSCRNSMGLSNDCWTGTGTVARDDSEVVEFTATAQAGNPILPKESPDETTTGAEDVLRAAIAINDMAYESEDLFVMELPPTVPAAILTEPKTTQGTSDGGIATEKPTTPAAVVTTDGGVTTDSGITTEKIATEPALVLPTETETDNVDPVDPVEPVDPEKMATEPAPVLPTETETDTVDLVDPVDPVDPVDNDSEDPEDPEDPDYNVTDEVKSDDNVDDKTPSSAAALSASLLVSFLVAARL